MKNLNNKGKFIKNRCVHNTISELVPKNIRAFLKYFVFFAITWDRSKVPMIADTLTATNWMKEHGM